MGRSIPTDEPAVLYPSLIADTSRRLQQLVNGWRGAERGEPLKVLHNACVNAVGLGGRHLLPAHVLLIADLDVTNLQIALRSFIGKGQAPSLRFRVRPSGRFDAVLVRFAASQSEVGARKLRAALVESLVAEEGEEVGEESSEDERRLKRVRAIRGRLGELVGRLREGMYEGD